MCVNIFASANARSVDCILCDFPHFPRYGLLHAFVVWLTSLYLFNVIVQTMWCFTSCCTYTRVERSSVLRISEYVRVCERGSEGVCVWVSNWVCACVLLCIYVCGRYVCVFVCPPKYRTQPYSKCFPAHFFTTHSYPNEMWTKDTHTIYHTPCDQIWRQRWASSAEARWNEKKKRRGPYEEKRNVRHWHFLRFCRKHFLLDKFAPIMWLLDTGEKKYEPNGKWPRVKRWSHWKLVDRRQFSIGFGRCVWLHNRTRRRKWRIRNKRMCTRMQFEIRPKTGVNFHLQSL